MKFILLLRMFSPLNFWIRKNKSLSSQGYGVVGQKTQQRWETYSSARIETPDPGKMMEFILPLRVFSPANFRIRKTEESPIQVSGCWSKDATTAGNSFISSN